MSSKTLAIVAITTQLILGLILVAILITLQGQKSKGFTVESMPWCQPGYVINCRQPQPVTVVP
jgi:hypothetical protein